MNRLADSISPHYATSVGFPLALHPPLPALQAGSNALIAVECYVITAIMGWLLIRRAAHPPLCVALLAGASIVSCGTTHLLQPLALWVTAPRLAGAVSAIAALLTAATAFALWPSVPVMLAGHRVLHPDGAHGAGIRERGHGSARAARSAPCPAEAAYHGIYNRTPAPLLIVSMDGTLFAISDLGCELLAHARNDVIGRQLLEFCVLETAEALHRNFPTLMEFGEVRELECVFRRPDDRLVNCLMSARLERDPAGQPLHILAALTDVTARRQAERALRTSEERLVQSQKMEAIGKLTGGIAHDFNNMLTVIHGSLELLKTTLGENHRARHLAESAERAAQRAARLTAQLLAFSRRQRLDPRPLRPHIVIEGMGELLSRTAGEQIFLHLPTRLPEDASESRGSWSCLADRNQFETALLNLVINAVAALSGGGDIWIAVNNIELNGGASAASDGDDDLAAGDYVSISVRDTGCGMSEEIRRRALEPFFTTRPIGQGTGLGLSQTYGFVRQSGGGLRIDSRPGEGTIVEMLLPRALAPQDAEPLSLLQAGSSASATDAPGRETLLVVEDEPEVLEIIAAGLRSRGYTVACAENATEALSALVAEPAISLIFTDMVMPGISGAALAEEARRLRPGIPIVFASGYSDETLRNQLPEGAVFLQKPYRVASLVKVIETELATSGPQIS